MSEWETLRAAAEIMEREGYPGAGSARQLGIKLQFRAVQDDQNYALAEELYEAWAAGRPGLSTWRGLGVAEASWWIRAARAARSYIAAESAENSAATEPEPLTVEPPVGSVVRDSDGYEWTRDVRGWRSDTTFVWWFTLRDTLGPLTLVSTPEETA